MLGPKRSVRIVFLKRKAIASSRPVLPIYDQSSLPCERNSLAVCQERMGKSNDDRLDRLDTTSAA